MKYIYFALILFVSILINASCLRLNRYKSHVNFYCRTQLHCSGVIDRPEFVTETDNVLVITKTASNHLSTMQLSQPTDKNILRIGVKKGGCSGMSYDMKFISASEVENVDHTEMLSGIKCVIDPKSLLFIYGMVLDYSNDLIGGGFKFSNPNAASSCGCGKSFGV